MEIKSGDELDLAVAKAVGLKSGVRMRHNYASSADLCVMVSSRDWNEIHGFEHTTWENDEPSIPFSPSTDIRSAFATAEKVGLFSETFWRVLGMDELGETWGVFDEGPFLEFGVSKTANSGDQHETPALAVCAAILKLKDK